MAGDIYELVNKATQANSKMGKVQLGYTVDTYKGVLAQLQKTQEALANVQQTPTGAAGMNTTSKPIFDRWTLMGEIEVSNAISADGFVVKAEDFDDVFAYRQIQCMIKPYMSFVVNLTDAQGKELTYFAQFDSHDQTLNNGTSVAAGGKSTYPMYNMDTSTCETIGTALGDMKTPFEMGIGVDITDESGCIDKFFKRCYPQVYKTGIGAKLVKNRAIFAEVSFPNGNKAKTLNVRVIADSKTPKGSYQFLYFPVPLLLSSDYNTLGVVTIKDGTVKTVGKDCKSPLENSIFDHQDAELSDFTPQLLKDILINKRVVTEANVTFDTASVADDNNIPHNVCYVRFYLDKTKEQAIKDIIGDIPSEYQSEIYKGVEEAKMSEKVIGWEDSMSALSAAVGLGSAAKGLKDDSAFYAQGQVDWVKFRQKHPNLPEGHENIIEMVAQMYNINTRMWMTQMGLETGWFTSKNFRQRKNPGGISAGSNYKSGQSYTLSYLGGITATKETSVRGEGYGHYWIFNSYEDGYRAMAHLLVNSSRYGLGKFGAKTVYEHFTNMFRGGYCDLREAVCQNYNDKLMNQYARVY